MTVNDGLVVDSVCDKSQFRLRLLLLDVRLECLMARSFVSLKIIKT